MMTEMGIMEECSSAKRMKSADKEFNPPVEMMVHDYDDERTLDEEEALASNEDPQAELSNLQKEGHMPLEELLALYGYADSNSSSNQEETEEVANPAPEEKKEVMKKELEEEAEQEIDKEGEEEEEEEEEEEAEPSQLSQLYEDIPPTPNAHPLRSVSRPQSEEEEEDYDYSPDEEEWKKVNFTQKIN